MGDNDSWQEQKRERERGGGINKLRAITRLVVDDDLLKSYF